MKIRKATLKDLNLLLKINKLAEDPLDKLLGVQDSYVKRLMKKLMVEKETEFFTCNSIGFIAFKKDFSGYENGEIFWLVVDKANRRMGIATALIKHVFSVAKGKKYRGVYLYTHPVHKPAMKLYRKLGFKKINEFPNYYSNGDKSIMFGKMLK